MFLKLLKILSLSLIFYCSIFEITNAYIFYSEAATKNYTKGETKILFFEVNLKSSDSDSFKIISKYKTNLKGYSLWTDKKIFSFEDNFELTQNEEFEIQTKNLTNTTEQIILLNPQQQIIDAICWENKNPSTSEAKDIKTLITLKEWKGDCFDSDLISKNEIIRRKNLIDTNTKADWELVLEESGGKERKIEPARRGEEIGFDNSNYIHINEFLPNPQGQDSSNEWIELYNSSTKTVNLEGWQLDDEEGGSKAYKFNNTSIKAKSYLTIPRSESKINLNNKEDTVRLIKPNGSVKEVSYEEAPEGQSYNLHENAWLWSIVNSPGMANSIVIEQELKEELKEAQIEILENGDLSDEIFFTEVFPNPEGKDQGKEWIEIYNNSNKRVNLGNWQIKSGNKSKKLSAEDKIAAQSHLIFTDEELGFSLKNSNAKIELLDFEGNKINELSYKSSEQDQSYTLIENLDTGQKTWQWIDSSPNEENPQIKRIKGSIKAINKEKLLIEDENLRQIEVTLAHDVTASSLKEESQIKLLALKYGSQNYKLHKIESVSLASNSSEQIPKQHHSKGKLLYPLGIIIILTLIFAGTKKLLKQLSIKLKIRKLISQNRLILKSIYIKEGQGKHHNHRTKQNPLHSKSKNSSENR